MSAPEVNAGVPVSVQKILTRALCAHWQMTFPDSTDRTLHVTTTSDPEVAMRLFDQTRFPWINRAQLAFLHTLPSFPLIRERTIQELLSARKSAHDFLTRYGMVGLLLPAVDGDFAAISFLDNQWSLLATTLQQECSRTGAAWDIISETEFRHSSWYTDRPQPIGGARQS